MKGQTFYSSLYDSLTSLIITRRLPYGSRLPSAKQLCSTYQVGIRTVQDVLRDMRDAGYISLEARKRAQVIWQPSQAHDEQTDFYILHTHRQMIDVLESMRLCLPPSAAGCAIYCRKRISAIYIKCYRRWRIIKIWKNADY
ncbi:MAG: GntR family transcriptional regulator [Clostridium sp.]